MMRWAQSRELQLVPLVTKRNATKNRAVFGNDEQQKGVL
jgi:hypothetical protein